MATLSLVDFPKFSESKEFLKIGRSEVCVGGGVLKVGLINRPYLYIYLFSCHACTVSAIQHGILALYFYIKGDQKKMSLFSLLACKITNF